MNNTTNAKEFGSWLRQIRDKNKITKEQVAEAGGITVQTIYNWENGKVDPLDIKLAKLANAYGLTVGEANDILEYARGRNKTALDEEQFIDQEVLNQCKEQANLYFKPESDIFKPKLLHFYVSDFAEWLSDKVVSWHITNFLGHIRIVHKLVNYKLLTQEEKGFYLLGIATKLRKSKHHVSLVNPDDNCLTLLVASKAEQEDICEQILEYILLPEKSFKQFSFTERRFFEKISNDFNEIHAKLKSIQENDLEQFSVSKYNTPSLSLGEYTLVIGRISKQDNGKTEIWATADDVIFSANEENFANEIQNLGADTLNALLSEDEVFVITNNNEPDFDSIVTDKQPTNEAWGIKFYFVDCKDDDPEQENENEQ